MLGVSQARYGPQDLFRGLPSYISEQGTTGEFVGKPPNVVMPFLS